MTSLLVLTAIKSIIGNIQLPLRYRPRHTPIWLVLTEVFPICVSGNLILLLLLMDGQWRCVWAENKKPRTSFVSSWIVMLILFQTETSQFISQNNYIFLNKLISKALGDSYLLTTLGIGYARLVSQTFNGDF